MESALDRCDGAEVWLLTETANRKSGPFRDDSVVDRQVLGYVATRAEAEAQLLARGEAWFHQHSPEVAINPFNLSLEQLLLISDHAVARSSPLCVDMVAREHVGGYFTKYETRHHIRIEAQPVGCLAAVTVSAPPPPLPGVRVFDSGVPLQLLRRHHDDNSSSRSAGSARSKSSQSQHDALIDELATRFAAAADPLPPLSDIPRPPSPVKVTVAPPVVASAEPKKSQHHPSLAVAQASVLQPPFHGTASLKARGFL